MIQDITHHKKHVLDMLYTERPYQLRVQILKDISGSF